MVKNDKLEMIKEQNKELKNTNENNRPLVEYVGFPPGQKSLKESLGSYVEQFYQINETRLERTSFVNSVSHEEIPNPKGAEQIEEKFQNKYKN